MAALFVNELNRLTGRSVEVAFNNSMVEGVIAFARADLLGLVESVPGYAPTNQVLYIAIDAIDFVRLL
ncbi:hypothetical protein [Alicyclobacillus fastidiosus]|uniref:Uncharacterized protein n=1 Tax=Alicyclobacillus fastidiosus TaxID=392011 RepID=A0ABV5AIE2_9BACL|nr:hypothetical protein [Alicyclobacillus fastidiosus]WEH10985.1 hypothetical protein PYS47_07145 [Alicyclobacillus fastidiosus]WEH11107.1 hypothetical protein PYS47_07785 [Alicyclobacillus fastidiosus]